MCGISADKCAHRVPNGLMDMVEVTNLGSAGSTLIYSGPHREKTETRSGFVEIFSGAIVRANKIKEIRFCYYAGGVRSNFRYSCKVR